MTAAVVVLASVLVLLWSRVLPRLTESDTWLWGPTGVMGPGPDEVRVWEDFTTRPRADVSPPGAKLLAERGGIGSDQVVLERRYCSDESLDAVRRFYSAQLPEYEWVHAKGHPGKFRKELEGRDAVLDVVGNEDSGCEGFNVRIEEHKPGNI